MDAHNARNSYSLEMEDVIGSKIRYMPIIAQPCLVSTTETVCLWHIAHKSKRWLFATPIPLSSSQIRDILGEGWCWNSFRSDFFVECSGLREF